MPLPNNLVSKLIVWASISSLALPVQAHKVKTSGAIGATLHVEPNDQARAQEPVVVWFALTRSGGQVVPLKQCQCQLQVIQLPSKKSVMQPALQSIDAEKYQGIPSSTILFQQPGAYSLELVGRPVSGANFLPFKLQFDLMVAPGKTPDKTTNLPTKAAPPEPFKILLLPAVLLATLIGLTLSKIKKK